MSKQSRSQSSGADTRTLRRAGVTLARASHVGRKVNRTRLIALASASTLAVIGCVAVGIWATQPGSDETVAMSVEPVLIDGTVQSELQVQSDALREAEERRVQLEADANQAAERARQLEQQLASLRTQSAPVETRSNGVALPICVANLKEFASDLRLAFGVGEVTPRGATLDQVAILASAANDCPEAEVIVEGHTDASGDDLSNLQLSWVRADNTIGWLQEQGYDIRQFQAVGFGARAPLAEGDDGDDNLNRRVEFSIQLVSSERKPD